MPHADAETKTQQLRTFEEINYLNGGLGKKRGVIVQIDPPEINYYLGVAELVDNTESDRLAQIGSVALKDVLNKTGRIWTAEEVIKAWVTQLDSEYMIDLIEDQVRKMADMPTIEWVPPQA